MKRGLAVLVACMMVLCSLSAFAEGLAHPLTTEPITITMFVGRNDATIKAEETYFIQYLEYWMEKQGYDINFDIQEATEADQQKQMMLGTADVPDLVIAVNLSNNEVVSYGVEQGVVLDWSPYLNEKYMPNLTAILKDNPHILQGITAPDGKVYALPQYSQPEWLGTVGHRSGCMYVNLKQLEDLGLQAPNTIEEFLDVLRAVKADYEARGVDSECVPVVGISNFLNTYLWYCLGYYGTDGWYNVYGEEFRIKDGEVVLPVCTEDYAVFIEIMNTMYKEGLISPDYLTMDGNVVTNYIKEDKCVMFGNWSLANCANYEEWSCLQPISIAGNDKTYISVVPDYTPGVIWTSAATKHPEVLAYLVDYMYSKEASMLQAYGPLEGQDPLGLFDGAYYNEETGTIASRDYDAGEDTSVASAAHFQQRYFRITNQGMMGVGQENYTRELLGAPTNEPVIVKDGVTGEDIVCSFATYVDMQKHWRESIFATWGPCQTKVTLPKPYFTSDETVTITELQTILNDYIAAESAKFIVGSRPLDEVKQFQEELKALGVEEYIEIYQNAYADFMAKTFSK